MINTILTGLQNAVLSFMGILISPFLLLFNALIPNFFIDAIFTFLTTFHRFLDFFFSAINLVCSFIALDPALLTIYISFVVGCFTISLGVQSFMFFKNVLPYFKFW